MKTTDFAPRGPWGFLLRLTALFALMLTIIAPVASGVAVAQSARAYYAEDTGHVLADPFLTYWAENDGFDRFGLPVTEELEYNDREAQFFEFGALVNAGDDEINRIKVGRDLLSIRHDPDRTVAGRRLPTTRLPNAFKPVEDENVEEGTIFDEETRHTVSGDFLDYYEDSGGRDVLGRPLSQAVTEFGVKEQWFELGRVVRNSDGAFLLAPTGYELARQMGLPVRRADSGNLPLLDPDALRIYKGDGTFPEATSPFAPVRITIPAIGVDSYIETVGIVDNVMQIPEDPWAVGWYEDLANPGEDDNIVMAGHRDWWGVGPVVFWDLGLLSPGDRVYLVAEDGAGTTYEVVSTGTVDASTDARTIIGDSDFETLTLITCSGDFTGTEYLSRSIVKAERI